jgi:hypothetical protein
LKVNSVLLNKVISFTGKKMSVSEVWMVLFSHNQKQEIQDKDLFRGNDNEFR